jgi:hypothetical protein
VPFLKERLKPVPVDRARVRRLLADLDNEEFTVREAASGELKQFGSAVESELRLLWKQDLSPEVRRRLAELLEPLDYGVLPPEQIRIVRAVQALERIGGPEARSALEAMTNVDPEGLPAREARRTLERIGR